MWKTDELGIGVMVRFGVPPEESFRRLHSFGLRNCQFAGVPDSYLYGEEGRRNTLELKKRMEREKIASCSVFCSFPDQDWKRGRETVGLTPPETRAERNIRLVRQMRHRDAQKPRDNVQHVDIRLDPVGLVIAVRGARAADLPRDDPLGDALRRAVEPQLFTERHRAHRLSSALPSKKFSISMPSSRAICSVRFASGLVLSRS